MSLSLAPSPARSVLGHDRWHPDIPAVAEVITGGTVRMECQGRAPGADAVLCGPLVVVGAEPGDVIVVDVLGVGPAGGGPARAGHPGVIGCAPDAGALRAAGGAEPAGVPALLGGVRPEAPGYGQVAAEAVRSETRGRQIGSCAIAPLTAGSRILLPVHVLGAKLSVGDLHFPASAAQDCRRAPLAGWIDLRVNLTRRGVERFRVAGPMLMPSPS
ncbi:acetamidase/formamidase family protein [Actinomadura parmotrematis]|uniref:Acetamidase/formamidase family protein n=1 Tax=Actinomadura parmotrematis TaxID=2864039 RepID=A0ABS7G040_9ACTN|nr:acetamidase/formamidase family protein [Actinomadura parmotrematis]MBW8486082.1 acetamidase/formamidase family protein [Actinomadura parmotrematis]